MSAQKEGSTAFSRGPTKSSLAQSLFVAIATDERTDRLPVFVLMCFPWPAFITAVVLMWAVRALYLSGTSQLYEKPKSSSVHRNAGKQTSDIPLVIH